MKEVKRCQLSVIKLTSPGDVVYSMATIVHNVDYFKVAGGAHVKKGKFSQVKSV